MKTDTKQTLNTAESGNKSKPLLANRFYVAEDEPKMKIISRQLDSREEAESFIESMKGTFAYENSDMIILTVC